MLFCPDCGDMTVSYFVGLNQAYCMNVEHCNYNEKFKSQKDCEKELRLSMRDWATVNKAKISPWSGMPVKTDMSDDELNSVSDLAKELHGVFTQASIDNKMLSAVDAHPFEEVPTNVKDTLAQLACYIYDNFRRKDGLKEE